VHLFSAGGEAGPCEAEEPLHQRGDADQQQRRPADLHHRSVRDAIDYQVSAGSLKSFSEREVAERTEIFGKIAHRFSTYEARFNPDDPEPLAIGINSIQFIKVGDSWHVSSLIWNDEGEDRKIPEKYIQT